MSPEIPGPGDSRPDELAAALTAALRALAPLVERDAELRARLRDLARALLALAEERAVPAAPEPPRPAAVAPPPPPAPAPAPAEPALVVPETIPAAPPPQSYYAERPQPQFTGDDLALIEKRCRLKARGARWAVTRRRRLAEGADFHQEIDPLDRELIEEARSLPDCFLWMNHPSGPQPDDPARFEDLAGGYEALAAALALARKLWPEVDEHREVFEQALDLAAEAQAIVRAAVAESGNPRRDDDQFKAYSWLRDMAREHQIFIRRYMRVDDQPGADGGADVQARLDALDAAFEETRRRGKHQEALVNKLRYHLNRLGPGGAGGHPSDWQRIVAVVVEMVGTGVQPSNAALRELLLPAIDGLPEDLDLPPPFQLVLREIDRVLAARRAQPEPSAGRAVGPQVAEVARRLVGRSAVLIGGCCRPDAKAALEAAFRLKELVWLESREHGSISVFEPPIARPDVAVVLLAIRWSSHSFGDVRQFCEAHGKPLVRLPAGYNPNQVAAQILAQCSNQLAAQFPAGAGS